MSDLPSKVKRRSAVEGRSIRVAGLLSVTPGEDAVRWSLRADEAAARELQTALGAEFVTPMLRVGTAAGVSFLRLSPDEWLVVAQASNMAVARFDDQCRGSPVSVVDVSDRQVGIILEGKSCEAVLSAYCPLDLSERAFPVGSCTRTVFARSEIVLWRKASSTFHIEAWRSFADYVWRGLKIAARDVSWASRSTLSIDEAPASGDAPLPGLYHP